jgi:hypothetical protein
VSFCVVFLSFCKRVQSDFPLHALRKALRQQGQASASGVADSNVSALETANIIPLASMAVGGRDESATSTSLPPNPTPSARVALSEAEVEMSVQMRMVALEQLLQFGPDPALEVALP